MTPDTPAGRILSKLGRVRKSGKGWSARCPAHEDKEPSLAVSVGEDGRVLLFCHAGCTVDSILAALGLSASDLFADNGQGDRPVEIATYDYVDEDGNVLYQVVRYAPKAFKQRRTDGSGGWTWKLGNTPRVLYRLPAVVAAARAGARVYVVEGERDVHAVERAGEVATTNPGGAGKWRTDYARALKGAEVVVVADRDEPGYKHSEVIARSLDGIASTVVVMEAAEGKDAADHLAAGRDLSELVPASDVARQHLTAKVSALDFHSAASVQMRRVRFAHEPILPLGQVTLHVGAPGIGKSTTAAWLAAGVSRGSLSGDLDRPARVVFLTGEDSWDTGIKPRLAAADADMDLVGWLERPDGEAPTFPRDVRALERFIAAEGVRLLVLDTVVDFADESMTTDASNLQARRLLMPLKVVAERTGVSVLALTHPNKGSGTGIDRVNASRAWGAAPRAVFVFGQDPDDEGAGLIAAQKVNGFALPPAQRFRIVARQVGVEDDGKPITAPTIVWAGEAPGVVADDLYSPIDEEEHGRRDLAVDFLTRSSVAEHARPAREIQAEAEALNINVRTLRRARRDLGIPRWKAGTAGTGWMWGPKPEGEDVRGQDVRGHTHPVPLSPLPSPAEMDPQTVKGDKGTTYVGVPDKDGRRRCAGCGELVHSTVGDAHRCDGHKASGAEEEAAS